MELGRVIGVVVASQKHASLDGIKLQVVQPLHPDRTDRGDAIIMADAMQSGVGYVVWYVLGREAALALPDTFAPVDYGIVGIVDRIDVDIKPGART